MRSSDGPTPLPHSLIPTPHSLHPLTLICGPLGLIIHVWSILWSLASLSLMLRGVEEEGEGEKMY